MLSFENENGRTSHAEYYLPKAEIKNIMWRLMAKIILINEKIMMLKHLKILEKSLLVKEMFKHVVVCQIILTSKKGIKRLQ